MMKKLRVSGLLLLVLSLLLLYACDTPLLTPQASEPTPIPQETLSGGAGNGPAGGSVGDQSVPNPGGGIPVNAVKPNPPTNTYNGCPSTGDGGDRQLNIRKNRTDSASWYPVSLASILALKYPFAIGGQPRSVWSAADKQTIAQYEGVPVQVEGYLAGVKQQGPESCNCHSADDVDNHLWIVDSQNKSRAESVVAEITPRVRASHPGWAFTRVLPLVNSGTKVRISGWLLMDQEHPDQIGKTRGTIWEIHPIIAFDVMRNGQWVELDTGRAAPAQSNNSGAIPTVDPNLPPPITDPFGGSEQATPTPKPPSTHAGGTASSSGAVQIKDIFYNGAINPNEPDEYVEIVNTGSSPVSLDGWKLHDIYGGQMFTWHNYTLEAGKTIRVYTNEVHPDSGGFSFGSSAAIWSNKGDAAELLDADGVVVSTFSYGGK